MYQTSWNIRSAEVIDGIVGLISCILIDVDEKMPENMPLYFIICASAATRGQLATKYVSRKSVLLSYCLCLPPFIVN
jgi:hypothetical protein